MTGEFHEGLREAMVPVTRCLYCPAAARPGDAVCADASCRAKLQRVRSHEQQIAAIMAEHSAAEQRVVAEHDRRPFDLCVTAGAEFNVIREMARAMEAEGDVPVLTWFRDEEGLMIGVTLVGHMAPTGLRYEPVGEP